ncbi:MAG: hypothetical protein F4244_12240, partial [Gammaproteobacteria bacterium]|nr:hypothetical protein [Gammaproteobacteria bacterium]
MSKIELVEPDESPADYYAGVRRACASELEDYGVSIAKAAAEIGRGVSQATLSQWLRGTYRGDVEAVTGRIGRWLATRAEARERGLDASGLDRHVPLGVTDEVEAALGYAQATGDMVAIHGRAGVGKTWA